MLGILGAFGLAAATGLNAYLPLLIVGLLARYTNLIALKAPWSALTHPVVLVVIGVLLIIEITVDKIPAVDTVNDVIQTVFRPAAGSHPVRRERQRHQQRQSGPGDGLWPAYRRRCPHG